MIGIKPRSEGGDPRVAKALEELDINFEVDSDGDFKFGFNLGEGRSQLGFIRSKTFEFGGLEMREIFSVGLNSFGAFDARTANFLLEQNGNVKIGGWAIARDDKDHHLALFSAKIAADLAGELLMGVIYAVLTTADRIEERLSGRDDF
jgi:hypothetical protein